MALPQRTPRQRIADLLTLSPMTTRQIAAVVKMSERQVEEHLGHIARSVARDRALRFVLDPSSCRECGFVFRDRQRLARPGRCPRCRGEAVTDPRYSIERRADNQS
jgi:transcriptional regulator